MGRPPNEYYIETPHDTLHLPHKLPGFLIQCLLSS